MRALHSGNPEALQFIGKNIVITIGLQKGGNTSLLNYLMR